MAVKVPCVPSQIEDITTTHRWLLIFCKHLVIPFIGVYAVQKIEVFCVYNG